MFSAKLYKIQVETIDERDLTVYAEDANSFTVWEGEKEVDIESLDSSDRDEIRHLLDMHFMDFEAQYYEQKSKRLMDTMVDCTRLYVDWLNRGGVA